MKKLKLFAQDGTELALELGTFPGGEVKVRILGDIPQKAGYCRIEAHLFNSVDVMQLIMLASACRANCLPLLRLTMPYVPYARQDRKCNDGESFSLAAFASIINSLCFASVSVYDPHSHVVQDTIERVIAVPSHELIKKHTAANDWILQSIWSGIPTYLVCPDKGAKERTEAIAARYSFKGVIYADKVRRPEDGVITGIELIDPPTDMKGSNMLVADDICDFGTTFVELAKVLKPYEPAEMNLYVTHGIFSGGKPRLLEYYNNVWCTVDFGFELDASTGKWVN